MKRHAIAVLARIVADWAEPLPLKAVYIFGSRARGDALEDSDIDVAIEFSDHTTNEQALAWNHENDTDFRDLKAALGVTLSLHADSFDGAWPAIKAAAQKPVTRIGKVLVVATPRHGPP
jgi:predicted nucleotidyltransferase